MAAAIGEEAARKNCTRVAFGVNSTDRNEPVRVIIVHYLRYNYSKLGSRGGAGDGGGNRGGGGQTPLRYGCVWDYFYSTQRTGAGHNSKDYHSK